MNISGAIRTAKTVLALAAIFGAIVGVLYLSWRMAGPIATVVYTFLFVFFFFFFPALIGIVGASTPFSETVSKLHIILTQFAFGTGYLVQREDKWEWCPGTSEKVFVDGQWHPIEGGGENLSILGWRPFGILRYKDDETYSNVRADTVAEQQRGATADGGTIKRAGLQEAAQPGVSGQDGTWLIDLKRAVSGGVRRIGDIEMIEVAEEIIERGEVKTSRSSYWAPVIGTIVGTIIGIFTGYIFLIAG